MTSSASQHNLNVNLSFFHVLTEDPHLSKFVQLVNQGTLDVVFDSQAFDDHFSVYWDYFQFLKRLSVLSSVITIDDSEDLHLRVELI